MDNLTHTLIGLVAGEAVARCAPAPARGLAPPVRRTALLLTGMIGGNLPATGWGPGQLRAVIGNATDLAHRIITEAGPQPCA